MSSKSHRRRKTGRKRTPDAQRNQTTRAARKGDLATDPAAIVARKRVALSGDARVGNDFPLDVLFARGRIDQEMRDEGLRFAQLAWSIFGLPETAAVAIEKMVSAGLAAETPQGTDEERERWLEARQREYRRMCRALASWPEAFNAVRNATQYLRHPRLVIDEADRRVSSRATYDEMSHLVFGLQRLAAARRHRETMLRPPPPYQALAALTTQSQRERERTQHLALARWFDGPLIKRVDDGDDP